MYCHDYADYAHDNVIKLNKRPFKDVEEMNEVMISNLNKVVGENDEVIHLGDFVWKGNFFDYLNRLNGFHTFLKGNHDHCYPTRLEGRNYLIRKNQIFEFTYKENYYVACHYPFYEKEWNRGYRKSIHLYGHTHRDLNIKNAVHVGVDTNNFTPVEL